MFKRLLTAALVVAAVVATFPKPFWDGVAAAESHGKHDEGEPGRRPLGR
jgi:hypothetical protein